MNNQRIKELEAEILAAKKAYYIDDDPIMSDDEFDLLEDELLLLDPENRILKMTGSDIKDKNNWPIEKLTFQMGSLEKVKSLQEFKSWFSTKGNPKNALWNPKGDGGSIEITYENGKIVKAVTRGNGYEGENIVANAVRMQNVPKTISETKQVVMAGEILILHDDFTKLNKIKPYANPRNAATGISKNINGTHCNFLTVLFYKFFIDGKEILPSEIDSFSKKMGVRNIGVFPIDDIENMYKIVSDNRGKFGFDVDGFVIKLDEHAKMKDNKPTNYIALKFEADKAIGIVEDIRFRKSRTGRIVPVAVLKNPVNLSGASVSKASLGSWELMNKKAIFPGSLVEIIRANDVIPYINRVTDSSKSKIMTLEDVQNKMGDPTVEVIGAHLYSLIKDEITIFFEIKNILKVLDFKNFSNSSLRDIIKLFNIKNSWEFFDINPDKLLNVDGWGSSKVDNLKQQIRDKREIDIKMFLRCLSINNLGGSRIAEICNTLGIVNVQDILDKFTSQNLLKIQGMGGTLSASYAAEINSKRQMIEELGKRVHIEKMKMKSDSMKGISFCITGKTSISRKDLEKIIVENGGSNKNVSKSDYLITNDTDSGSSKNKKATQLGVKIISEKDFKNIFQINY